MGGRAKPRVLILATRVPLESGDGTPSFILDSAMALSSEFDITILAPRIQGSRPTERHGRVIVRRFPYFPARWECLADDAIMPQLGKSRALWLQAPPLTAMLMWQTLRQHRTNRPDIVHANWVLPAGLIALITNLIHGTPYLVTSHGADAFRLNSGPLRILNRAVLARSKRFIGVSADIVEQFGDLSIPVAVQPVAVDFALWQALVGVRTPVPGRVLFVGRLDAKKGIGDAIRAITGLDGVQLRVVGDGPLAGELKALSASLSSTGRVAFLGRRSREEVAEEMRMASCLIIPSVIAADGDREGTPSVLGEAIAAGVPVVASRLAGLAEYVLDGETGRLHEPGDVAGLRACLRGILLDPEMGESLARSAQSRFFGDLDRSHVAMRYSVWYRDALSATRNGL